MHALAKMRVIVLGLATWAIGQPIVVIITVVVAPKSATISSQYHFCNERSLILTLAKATVNAILAVLGFAPWAILQQTAVTIVAFLQ